MALYFAPTWNLQTRSFPLPAPGGISCFK